MNKSKTKVAVVSSEEVTVELLKVKCLPVLLYGLNQLVNQFI